MDDLFDFDDLYRLYGGYEGLFRSRSGLGRFARFGRRSKKKKPKTGPRKSLKGVPRAQTENPKHPRKGAADVAYGAMQVASFASESTSCVNVSVPSEPFDFSGLVSSRKGKGKRSTQSKHSCSRACCVLETDLGIKNYADLRDILPAGKWLAIGGRTDHLSLKHFLMKHPISARTSFAPIADAHRAMICAAPGVAAYWQPVEPAAAMEVCDACNPVKILPKRRQGYETKEHKWEMEKAERSHKVLLKKRPTPLDVEIQPSGDNCHCQMRVLVRPCVPLHRLVGKNALQNSVGSNYEFWWMVATTQIANAMHPSHGGADVKFSLLSNAEDAPHEQPPHFKEYELRPEQLRSLHWMVQQEKSTEPFILELTESIPVDDLPGWHVEGRARCALGVHGGVLGDKIGYGKTAVTIGLIDCTLPDSLPTCREQLIPSRATLVLAPTNLHQQWVDEIRKFTGGALRVLSVATCAQLRALRVRDLQEADVVVCTYRLFYSDRYLERIAALVRRQREGQGGAGFKFPAAESNEFEASYEDAVGSLKKWVAEFLPDAIANGDGLVKEETPNGKKGRERKSAVRASSKGRGRGRGNIGAQADAQPDCSEVQTPVRAGNRPAAEEILLPSPDSSEKQEAPETIFEIGQDDSYADQPAEPAKKRRVMEVPVEPGPSDDHRSFKYPPLEVFYWQRVVFDEFHELLRSYPPALVAARLFHSRNRFGLSGTPPINSIREVQASAKLFGVALPSKTSAPNSMQIAQEWIDRFMRQNTAEVAPVSIKEDIVLVRQSPNERALYLQRAQENSDLEGAGTDSLAHMEQLLKLCSHFHDGSQNGGAASAEDQCKKVLGRLSKRLKSCESACQSRAACIVDVYCCIRYFDPNYIDRDYSALVVQPGEKIDSSRDSKTVVVEADGSTEAPTVVETDCSKEAPIVRTLGKRLRRKTCLLGSEHPVFSDAAVNRANFHEDVNPWLSLDEEILDSSTFSGELASQYLRTGLSCLEKNITASFDRGHVSDRCKELLRSLGLPETSLLHLPGDVKEVPGRSLVRGAQAKSLQSAVDDCKNNLHDLLFALAKSRSELESAVSSYRFFKAVLQAPSECLECPVCMEKPQDSMFPCAHLGCYDCLSRIAAGRDGVVRQCPICRSDVRPTDVFRFRSAPHGQDVPGGVEDPARFAKFGSKIKMVVEHMGRIWSSEPDARVIVFVQWEDLKEKLSTALSEFKFAHLTLQGNVWTRRDALAKFKAPLSEQHPRVLLLSLEDCASGTNLTEAHHVIMIHPMCAADQATAVAYEMQAIGRVARPGQTKEVNVWRFVTADSVESSLTERHQHELWKRRSPPSNIAPVVNASSSSSSAADSANSSDAWNDFLRLTDSDSDSSSSSSSLSGADVSDSDLDC